VITGAFLGLDLGGTGAKAGVYDGKGNLLGFGHASYSPLTTEDGHADIPVEEIYSAARNAAISAISAGGVDVCAMAVSSQGQTFVSIDGDGTPLHPAIMWYDSRARDEAQYLRENLTPASDSSPTPHIEGITPAAKIIWLRSRYPDLMRRARKYLLLPDYIAWKMTGEAVTDPTTASSTGFYADDAPGYSRDAMFVAGVNEDQLARIQASGSVIGRIRPEIAADWGLSADAILVTGANDQYCGALGAGVCRSGIASETSGTCLALVTLAERLPDHLPTTISTGRFPIPRYRFFLAYEKDCGLVLDRFRREACPGKSFAELDAEATQFPLIGDGITTGSEVSAFFGGKFGSSVRNTPSRIYRSMLVSLSFSLREYADLMRSCGLLFDTIRCIGGGAKSNLWLQIKADVTGLAIERPKVTESATLGAAILARVGVLEDLSIEECSSAIYHTDCVFEPNRHMRDFYEDAYASCREVARITE
jgi:xylulokinase